MLRAPMRLALLQLLAVTALAIAPAARAASTPDDQARFLAGLPVSAGSPLASLQETPGWKAHQRAMDDAWTRLSRRLGQMEGWAKAELAPHIQKDAKLLYLFGGPDAVTPLWLYPDAPAYLLCGLEPIGQAPPPEDLKPKALDTALSSLATALRTVVPTSFFRTEEMGHDLSGDAIDGVQPLLYLFIARSGGTLLGVERFEIDDSGVATPKADGEAWGGGLHGIRVRFQREGRAPQELSYVQADLGDTALERTPGFQRYVRAFGQANAFLKAASFILHDRHFLKPRALLIEQSLSVLQDDSGLPLRAFEKEGWAFTPFGTYLVPKKPFQGNFQKELSTLFQKGPAKPLPFIMGYRSSPAESNLLLAVRKPAAAASAPEASASEPATGR